jgi:hypothetical protein
VNEYLKKCLVKSELNRPINEFLVIGMEVIKGNVFETNIGDCFGNPLGYFGREIWLLESYRQETLELMALEKLSGIYKKGGKSIGEIITVSDSKFSKLIDYSTKFIEYKDILDKAESRLELASKNLEDMKIKENEISTFTDFNINGLLMKVYEGEDMNTHKLSKIISIADIGKNKVKAFNYIQVFNNIFEEYDFDISLFQKIYITGYLINTKWKSIKIKIETNCDFELMLNNLNVFNIKQKSRDSNIYNSEYINIAYNSLNRFQLLLMKNAREADFKISIIESEAGNLLTLGNKDFIPFKPFEHFNIDKDDLYNDIETVDCSAVNLKSPVGLCTHECINAPTINICKSSFENNIIPFQGGLISSKVLDYGQIGLNYLITEVKLGYINEYHNFSEQVQAQLSQNYHINIDKQATGSFLFSKREVNPTKDILVDIKLICDNNNDAFKTSLSNEYKIEKLHDMINGFTILLIYAFKNSFGDANFIDYIKLAVYDLQNIPQAEDYNSQKYNRLICSNNDNKKIILEYIYNRNDYMTNIPDIHANGKNFEDIHKYFKETNKSELVINCSNSDQNNEICIKAKNEGVIMNQGNFSLKQVDNNVLEFNMLYNKLPVLEIFSDVNYKIYESDVELNDIKAINYKYSSFLQISSSTQFYSNDLLAKLEKGLNSVTDRILDQSKTILEVEK